MRIPRLCGRLVISLILAMLGATNWAMRNASSSTAAISGLSTVSIGSNLTNGRGPDNAGSHHTPEAAKPELDRVTRMQTEERYGRLPLSFESNRGQVDSRVKFLSRSSDYSLFLTSNEAVLVSNNDHITDSKSIPARRKRARAAASVLRMRILGSKTSLLEGVNQLPGCSNYFIGSDASRWRTNLPNYSAVQYRDVYPGVNLIYYGNQRQLEYDFVVAPNSDPRVIKLGFKGARRIRIDSEGDLVLQTSGGNVRMRKPSVYQDIDGVKQPVAGRYVLNGKMQVGFDVGAYDRSKTLVIDPVFSYSTFLGGTSFDEGRAIAIDAAGNAYVTGRTQSFNFPITIDAFSTTYSNSTDVFVTKMNADGSALVYSTYIGGTFDDNGFGIVVDSTGNAYITGSTSSSGFPTTPGAFQTMIRGTGDAFVTKLNSTGTALVYSTFMGGTSSDQANSIDIDSLGNAYVAGFTVSTNFPITPGSFQSTNGGGSFPGDCFITKLNDTGAAQIYSTYLGGSSSDQATGIKVDSSGNAFVAGSTRSTNFPTTPMAFQTVLSALSDVCVTKLNDTGAALIYSTYLGGTGDEGALGIATNSAGEVFITGSTSSGFFPTTPGVLRVSNGGLSKTTDNGDSWGAINGGLTSSTILTLAIDPAVPEIVYAGTSFGGVFKSTNGGINWSATNSGLTDLVTKALAIDPVTPSVIYLGTSNRGVFKSTNSGATWRGINTGQNGANVNVLRIDPATNTTVYAGTDQGVFKTTNSGATWTGINSGFNQGLVINTLVIDPLTTSTVYAGLGFGGVFKSTNGGANWSSTGLTNTNIKTLAIDPSNPSILYAGTDAGVLKSTDGGMNWNAAIAGLANRMVGVLAIPAASQSTIYAGTANGVFKSTDAGGVWSAANLGLYGAVVNALAIDPLDPMVIYSGAAAGGTDAFIAELNSTGGSLSYSTLLGASNTDQGTAIALDTSGNAYVTGSTNSANFPTTPGGFQSPSNFDSNAFVTKFNTSGTALVYSTLVGGTFDFDGGFGITVDSAGSSYITGSTSSRNFPVTPEAFQTVLVGFNSDAFICKLVPAPLVTSDLAITMTVSPTSGVAGESIVYNITVINEGSEPASAVTVSDELPPSLVFNNCSSQFFCERAGNSVTFRIGSLDAGASATMTIFASISCSIASSVMISNTVTVDYSGSDPDTSNNSATATSSATNPETSLSPTSQSFGVNGGGFNTVFVNRGANCSWTSISNDSWITINFSSTCCNGIVQYTVAPNPNPGPPRLGTMTIAGKTFTVIQAGACNFGIAPENTSFAANGGTGSVELTAPDLCQWSAFSNNPSFLTITSASSGTGSATVTYSVAANPNTTNRSGTLFIAGRTFTVFQGAAFLDVPLDHPFYTEIGKLSARGVTQGCLGGNYCPNDSVTREQMAAFIIRALGEFNPPPPAVQRFNDVPPSNLFYAFIDRLAALGITEGCSVSPPLYCPSDTVRREQMAAFIIRALEEVVPVPAVQRFDDVPPSNLFYAFIDRMAALGITSGCSTSPPLFCPADLVTRGQMAVFLVRAFEL